MGISFLIGGFDIYNGMQLYCTDPSGNYSAWKAHVIGSNNVNGIGLLKEEYVEGCSFMDGVQLAIKVLCKTLETIHPKPEEIEIFSIRKGEKGELVIHNWKEGEIKEAIDKLPKEVKI